MNHFVVQVYRCGEWRNVTTIQIETSHNSLDTDRGITRAYRQAMKCLAGWQSYFSEPLRIAEPTITGGYKEARP